MACRIPGRKEVPVSSAVNPNYREVLKTYCHAADLKLTEIPHDTKSGLSAERLALNPETACFILQQPNYFGNIEQPNHPSTLAHQQGALFIVSVDPISLGILKAPGDYGADIVVGEGQALGNSMNFGGPGLGLFATKQEYLRQMPGRIVGATTDTNGKRGFVLTMSTREQHIRRERATSNICSNEALCALAACVYLAVMGKEGLRKVAELCLQKARYLKKRLGKQVRWPDTPSFKEFMLKDNRILCVTELIKKEAMDKLVREFCATQGLV